VLIAVASVRVVFVAMLLWLIVARIFRQRFQFSIRSLFGLTVTVAIPCSWLAVEMKAAKEQKDRRVAIDQGGGGYEHDWRFDASGDYVAKPHPPGPEWLCRLLGSDAFTEVVRVSYVSSLDRQITNPDLSPLEGLKHIRYLWLDSVGVTDAELEHLKGLSELFFLSLEGGRVTDNGLRHLAGLTKLETLTLNGTKITDLGLEYISGLPELKYLSLCRTEITDEGLRSIARMTHLRDLRISRTHVTDEGVKKLQQALPNCKIER